MESKRGGDHHVRRTHGNLHSDQGRKIMDLFKTLNEQGTAIAQVTHSEATASYGSRIITLRDGFMES